MLKRIITGICLACIFIFSWLNGGYFLKLCVSFLAIVGSWEFFRMFFKEDGAKITYLGTGLAILYTLLSLYFFENVPNNETLPLIMVSLIVAIISLIYWSKNVYHSLYDGAILITGLVYVPTILLSILKLSPYEQLFVFLIPAANDTFAYFTGMAIGKHKIWEKVSPKKSVEGSIGGFIATIICTVLFCWHFGQASQGNNVILYAILGGVLSIMAQMGDFFESALKRHTNIKDSSNIFPGHGGVLDRMDSVLFVVPTYLFITSILPQLSF